jgi:hypothetical protein
MLIAVDEHNKKLILGLHDDNIALLKNDRPIMKYLGDEDGMPVELADWSVVILGPEDVERFVAHFEVTRR